MSTRTALVRRPSPRLAEGIVTHREREAVNFRRACTQWDGYVAALHENGWQTIEVSPAEDCPDSVFVEDTVVVHRSVAVISRPGADTRKAETVEVEKAIEDLGYSINRIRPPGTLDGGDVLKVDDTVYVGRSGRTNAEGIRQLRAVLEPIGARVVAVPVTKVLHLKSAVTALPDGTVIGYLPLVDDPLIFGRFMPVPEESGAQVVLLGEGRLLISHDCTGSIGLLEGLGYEPVPVDVGEYLKLEGSVTCMSVRLRELPGR